MGSLALAAGVLSPETRLIDLRTGVSCSPTGCTVVVGDKAVNGWWKLDDHVRGVPGTYGNGYDGVRKGRPSAGVGGTLARTVLADSVDSVDTVDSGRDVDSGGLAKAAFMEGDMSAPSSSLMGEIRFNPELLLP